MTSAPFLTLPPGGLEPEKVWWMTSPDGVRLRAAHWPGQGSDALAVLLSGRTEFIEKFSVPAAAFVARGYQVVSLDWRGQGLSDRSAQPGRKGHVGTFAEYQRDLDTLLESDAVQAVAPGPRLLVAHSMGGAIATAALMRVEIAGSFDAAVLSAPMFGIAMPGVMRAAAWLVTKVGLALGMAERWPPFGDVATPYVLTSPKQNVLTHDAQIWDWLVETARTHENLNLAMPTIGWFQAASEQMAGFRRARPMALPALCLLGGAEAVVDPAAVRSVSARLGITLAEIPNARHEHFHEAEVYRTAAWTKIDQFLSANGLPSM